MYYKINQIYKFQFTAPSLYHTAPTKSIHNQNHRHTPPPHRLFCGEMQNFHKNLVIFTALVYNERVFAEQMGYVNDLFRQTKETLHKARLTALHAICLQIFRHIAQKSLAIRKYACGISMQSAEKSDYASYAQALCSVSQTKRSLSHEF